MKKLILIILFITFWGCSTSQNTTKDNTKEKDEVYVFDSIGYGETKKDADNKPVLEDSVATIDSVIDVPPLPPIVEEVKTPEENQILYFVQIGAFTTQERAEEFVHEVKQYLNNDLTITFNDEKELFVVQLAPFTDKTLAETERNRLWKYEIFKDAFIITQ